MALAGLLHLRRPQTLEDQRAAHTYSGHVREAVLRVREMFARWVELREVEPDNARLANAAAVNRWDTMRLASHVQELAAPRSMTNAHRNLHMHILNCARACQLLANGYRFHKSEAVCDGQALLVESADALAALVNDVQLH
ncbi:MAG: hypothetical protein NVSMB2_28300 [Chloroflexota bacterium]